MAETIETLKKELAAEKAARLKDKEAADVALEIEKSAKEIAESALEEEIILKDAAVAAVENEKSAKEAVEDAFEDSKLVAETALALVDEMKAEVDSKPVSGKADNSFEFKKKTYVCHIPKFMGIPGHSGKSFTIADLRENVIKVDYKEEKLKLVDYLLKIESTVITLKG